MNFDEISKILLDTCYSIHKKLGPGLFESVYESVLCYELKKQNLFYERQVPIPIIWDGFVLDEPFKADIIIEKKVLVELKSIEKSLPVHKKQVITYLKLSKMNLGYLINLGEELMKTGITRIINSCS